jgi:hypothetical protein
MKLIDTKPEHFNKNYIYFNEPIQNTIISESRFIRILYSTPNIIFNGINILLKINIENVDKQYNKNIIYYNIEKNAEMVNNIKNIEENILEKYSTEKEPAFNLISQVNTGALKLFSDYNEKKKNIDVILKISGLWEDNLSYGITYKFLSVY